MRTHKNSKNDTKIESRLDTKRNKTIIRSVEDEDDTSVKHSRSIFEKQRSKAPKQQEEKSATPPEKKLFLYPESKNISKDNDNLTVSQKPAIKMRAPKKTPEPPVEVAPVERPCYVLNIAPDNFEALLMVYRRDTPYTKSELLDYLHTNGIVHGINEDLLDEIASGKYYYEDVVIASGTPAKEGRDGFYEFHFNPHPETKPIILSDGSVDYNTLGQVELVIPDQLLVTYHNSIPATNGIDIKGNIVPVTPSIDLPPLRCKNCELDENGYEYYATAEGNAVYDNGELSVTPIFVVDGDLEAATGDVNFHGDVLITGNVFANVTIKTTGNITINGHVEIANLFAGKDVLLKNGMQGSGIGQISAKGNVFAKFLEQTTVYAGKEINTGALLNCDVEAGDRIVVTGKRGSIIGGTTVAAEHISAFSLGNRVGVNTKIIVGLEKDFKLVMDELDNSIEDVSRLIRESELMLDRIEYELRKNPKATELISERTEQMRNKIVYKSRLSELSSKREQVIDLNERASDGEIIITGPAYVGCNIIINGVSENLKSEYRDVTFTKSRREIRILANKLKE